MPDALPVAPGAEEHFRVLFDLVYAPALDYGEHLASRMDTEDAVHDTLGEIWVRWRVSGPESIPLPVFLGIVRHKLLDLRRTARRRNSATWRIA